jgi:hypothetical protein
MAVINAYTDSLAAEGKKSSPGNMAPGSVFAFAMTFEVAAEDGILSVYRIANLNSNLIPLSLLLACDAAIDITDLDIGLYEPGANGPAVDADCFADAINPDAGYIFGSDLEGLISLPIADCGKKLWEITSVVTAKSYTAASHPQSFDLVLTAKTEPGAAGTISVRGMFIQG